MIIDFNIFNLNLEGTDGYNNNDEHYKLLVYLVNTFNNSIIFNIGTEGNNIRALRSNPTNTVYSFTGDNISEIKNEHMLHSAIIFVDIEPHNGKKEYDLYVWLKENKYKGLFILDDIHYFKEMRDNCWHHIPTNEKYDLTKLGHWSGTGIVTNQKIEIENL